MENQVTEKKPMTKKAIIMLVFACLFATVTLVLVFLDSLTSISTYTLLFGKDTDLGDAIGGIFLYLYTILLGIGIVISCALTLPFVLILMKLNGWKWYVIALLAFTILAFVLAVGYVCMLPVVSNIEQAAKAHSSSSSIPESALALL